LIEVLTAFAGHFHEAGPVGHAILVFAVALGVVVFVPSGAMALAAGVALGLTAAPAVIVGATAGSAAAALISRHLLRDRVAAAVARRPQLRAVLEALEHDGWWVVCLLRLGSPVPGALLSYGVGVTGIGMARFCSATLVGKTLPLTVLVSVGAAGRAALERAEIPTAQLVLLGAGLVSTALAVALVARRVRAILRGGGAAPPAVRGSKAVRWRRGEAPLGPVRLERHQPVK
jgi:uncharacterized membrane protein YdjX (TVP38/TMEM64 family)